MKRFKNILFVSSGSEAQHQSLQRTLLLAERNSAALTVLDTYSTAPGETDEQNRNPLEELEPLLAPYRSKLRIRTEFRPGRLFFETIRTVLRNDHDLVIKTAEKPDFLQRLFGSHDMHLLRKCPCPLWLMKAPESTTYRCIVAAIDFNPHQETPDEQILNRQIIELAASQALSEGATLHLLHAWQPFGERKIQARSNANERLIDEYADKEQLLHHNRLRQLSDAVRHTFGSGAYDRIAPRLQTLKGSADRQIPQFIKAIDADLVVMGTLSRAGIIGLLIGNTAEAILDQLSCSVLAVKPPGFITPIRPE